jgi:predicted nucleic acid-binding protein
MKDADNESHGVNEVYVNANSCHLAEPAEIPALHRTRRWWRSPGTRTGRCRDHRPPQGTDAYLAHLARSYAVRLATFDLAFAKLQADVADLIPAG